MPLRSALMSEHNEAEQMFAFVLAINGPVLMLFGELRVYSGDWTRVDWAQHVYNILWRGGLSSLPGADGRCFVVTRALIDFPLQISHTCDVCNRMLPASRMQRCSGCHFARYCSGRCLSAGWYNGHREECGQIQEVFPRAHFRRHLDQYYGYISRYDFELWLHLMS